MSIIIIIILRQSPSTSSSSSSSSSFSYFQPIFFCTFRLPSNICPSITRFVCFLNFFSCRLLFLLLWLSLLLRSLHRRGDLIVSVHERDSVYLLYIYTAEEAQQGLYRTHAATNAKNNVGLRFSHSLESWKIHSLTSQSLFLFFLLIGDNKLEISNNKKKSVMTTTTTR